MSCDAVIIMIKWRSLTTHHFVAFKNVRCVGNCHNTSTALSDYWNGTVALYTRYCNCVYIVHVAIECTTVFDEDTSIARGKYVN